MYFTPIDIHLTPNDNHLTIYGTVPQVNKEFSWGHHLLFSIQWNLLCQYSVTYPYYRGTLRSRHGAGVDFDKICVFCGKFCIHIDKCVFIVIKIKCWILIELVIFVIKLILLQTTHILQHLIYIYQNTHKYYNFWHLWWDGPTTEPKNFILLNYEKLKQN